MGIIRRAGQSGKVARSKTLIAEGCTIVGELKLEGDLHLDGSVNGTITAVGVSIGKAGVSKGDITAEQVTVAGRIEGKVSCQLLELLDGCHVMGEIQCVDLVVEKGARFIGNIRDMHAVAMVEQDLLPAAPESALNA